AGRTRRAPPACRRCRETRSARGRNTRAARAVPAPPRRRTPPGTSHSDREETGTRASCGGLLLQASQDEGQRDAELIEHHRLGDEPAHPTDERGEPDLLHDEA